MAKKQAGSTPAPKQPNQAPAAAKKPRAGKAASEKKQKPLTPAERIENYGGIEVISEELANGQTMTAIAQKIGVTVGQLSVWLASDEERSARAREARAYAARIWDDEAERVIQQAGDGFELSRAKELAHHYRWRASKIAPKDYGDKVTNEHTGANGGAIQVQSTVTFVRAPGSQEQK